jgi:hypothetical protein
VPSRAILLREQQWRDAASQRDQLRLTTGITEALLRSRLALAELRSVNVRREVGISSGPRRVAPGPSDPPPPRDDGWGHQNNPNGSHAIASFRATAELISIAQ